MRKPVLVIGTVLAALSTAALAGGKRHVTLRFINQTANDFANGNAEHKQVHADPVLTTVQRDQTGLVKLHFDEDTFSGVMTNVTYLAASGNGGEVEISHHIDTSGSACKIVTPPDLEGNDGDCHDIDIHHDFAIK